MKKESQAGYSFPPMADQDTRRKRIAHLKAVLLRAEIPSLREELGARLLEEGE